MKKEELKSSLKEAQNLVVFILLAIWMVIPVFEEIEVTKYIVLVKHVYLMLAGIAGVYFFTGNIYVEFLKNRKDIKEYFKSISPIILFLLYMIWTLISSLLSTNKELSLFGTEYRKEGYITYLAYAGFFGLAFLGDSRKHKKILLNIFLFTTILNIIFFELVNRGFLKDILVNNSVDEGIFENINHYGYYLLIATVVSDFLLIVENHKFKKIVYGLIYTFLVYYLILNNTFGCFLAFMICLFLFVIYCVFKKQKLVIACVSVVIFLCMSCCVWKNGQNIAYENLKSFGMDLLKLVNINKIDKQEVMRIGTSRMRLWKYGVKFFFEKPILGYGPENLEEKYMEFNIVQDRPHNLLIQLATTSGLPGLILYLSGIGIILIRALKSMKLENEIQIVSFFTVLAYLISAQFGNSMYYTSPYFFIVLGILMNENIKAEKYKKIE